MAEWSAVVFVECHVEGQRMTVTIKHASVGAVAFPTNADARAYIGIEACIHVILTLGSLHLVTERLPVINISNGIEVFLHLTLIVKADG